MSSKKTNDLDKECPICGSIIWGKGVRVLIEGAKITVCQACAQYGTKIIRKQSPSPTQKISQTKKSTQKPHYHKPLVDDLEIVEDYDARIRKVRQSLGLNQDQFANKLNEKPSLMRRIESGKAKPTVKLARKIEKIYNITLIKTSNEVETSAQTSPYMKKSGGASLGDIAFVKKKKS